MSNEFITKLPAAQQLVIEDLKSRGVSTSVLKVPKDEPEYSCCMRTSDGRDVELAYGKTPEEAVNQCAKNLKAIYSDLFAK